VCALESALREQDPVARQDRHGNPLDPSEAAHKCLSVELLELVETAAVDHSRDHLADVVADPVVLRDDPVQLRRVVEGGLRLCRFPKMLRRCVTEMGDDRPRDRERVPVVGRVVVRDAGNA
jgi:hypothetical protein